MAQVIHSNARFLGLAVLVVRVLLKRADQVFATIPNLDLPLLNKAIEGVDPVFQITGLLCCTFT